MGVEELEVWVTCDSAQMVTVSLLTSVFLFIKWEDSYLQLWFSLAYKAHSTALAAPPCFPSTRMAAITKVRLSLVS